MYGLSTEIGTKTEGAPYNQVRLVVDQIWLIAHGDLNITSTGVRHCSGYGTGGDGSVPVHDLLKLCLAQRCPRCLHVTDICHKDNRDTASLESRSPRLFRCDQLNPHINASQPLKKKHFLTGHQDHIPLSHKVAGVRMGRLVREALGCRWGACCCCQAVGRMQG